MAKKKKTQKPKPSPGVILPPEDSTLLPGRYERVARSLAEGVSARQAAFSAGFSQNSGTWLSRHPQIKARVIEIKLELQEDLRKQSAASSEMRIVPRVTIQRNDIINGLAAIAQDIKMQGRARVAAYLGLADIFMLRARNVKDLMDFYGWTNEEMDEYATTGQPPARIRSLLGEGAFKALAEAASFRTEK